MTTNARPPNNFQINYEAVTADFTSSRPRQNCDDVEADFTSTKFEDPAFETNNSSEEDLGRVYCDMNTSMSPPESQPDYALMCSSKDQKNIAGSSQNQRHKHYEEHNVCRSPQNQQEKEYILFKPFGNSQDDKSISTFIRNQQQNMYATELPRKLQNNMHTIDLPRNQQEKIVHMTALPRDQHYEVSIEFNYTVCGVCFIF